MPAATRSRRVQTRGGGAGFRADDAASDAMSFQQPHPASSAGASASIYDAFADIYLQSTHAQQQDEDPAADGQEVGSPLLDLEHGTALQYAEACRERLVASTSSEGEGQARRAFDRDSFMEQDGENDAPEDDFDKAQWALEYNTWMILHALSVERTQTRTKAYSGDEPASLRSNPYHPALLRASDVLAQSPALRELNIVREWLHTILDPYEGLPLLLSNSDPSSSSSNAQRNAVFGGAGPSSSSKRADSMSKIVEVRKGYWAFTKNALRAAKRGGHIPASNSTTAGLSGGGGAGLTTSSSFMAGASSSSLFGGIRKSGVGIGGGAGALASSGQKLLKTLDPDAPCRAGEGELANEDLAYERAFLRSLFELARAGKLTDALELCRQADRPWRAASLRGAIPYFDPRLVNQNDPSVDSETIQALPQSPYGNRNRALWKATARKLAGMKTLDPYERALYGALSGSLEPVLACSSATWEEAVWAYVNAKLEAGVENGLRKSLFAQRNASALIRVKRELFDDEDEDDGTGSEMQGGYDVDGVSANGDGNEAKRARTAAAARLGLGVGNDLTLRQSEDETALEALRMEDLFEQVEARVDRASNSGSPAGGDPFHAAQRVTILGDIRPLLVTFASNMEMYQGDIPQKSYARYVRFFAHLVLYLRRLSSVWATLTPPRYENRLASGAALGALLLPEPICDNILREYIRVLRVANQSDRLVAMYSSALLQRAAGVEEYAAYLLSMGLDVSAEARSRALFRASESGLNLGAVARRTVYLIFADLLPHVLPPLEIARLELGSLRRNEEGEVTALASGANPVAQYEVHLLHALEWLTFAEETYGNAVLRYNQLVRYFLASGRLAAARQATSRLPSVVLVQLSSLAVNEDGDNDATFDALMSEDGTDGEQQNGMSRKLQHVEQLECLSWQNLFDALDAYQQYVAVAAERERNMTSATKKTEFTAALSSVIAEAEEAIRVVLEGDWLRFELDGDVPEDYEARLFEYKRIRQLFVPELVLSLHYMLIDSRDLLPDTLARALVLPNLVADGSHALWQDFISRPAEDDVEEDPEASVQPEGQKTNRLPEYLEAIRQAELTALDSLGPDPFRAAILVNDEEEGEDME
ncbi:unnamed protein product [Tilletia controversa]|uniref:Nuclear pore complex protein n=2 Tax=Tilletia TaxID=13289 RepID=A0A177VGX7_9BASI|nr:hypothetical protein CF336_g510 [Tilletia laevis]KAE8265713.1 hypothetical protein A4X03_0g87 [Tilletia caries]CAD6905849.1 unnamed protein product [Tilletia controversa]KAE8207827.1 hypothetical protein CF335_g865 [Tilletia laevis]CAD6884836.1 unnamed protein product [Tilletia caries]